MSSRKPNHIDRHIAARIKQQRKACNVTMVGLAAALSISYQQLQKYKARKSRMPASVLYETAKILDTPIERFFDDRDF